MITGVETAGLVLAVIPLLISAFEHYNDTRGALRKFLNKRQYIKRIIGPLDEQRVLIENELDHVLRMGGFAEEADDIGVTSYQSILIREDVAEGLQIVLGRSYEAYTRSIMRCGNSIVEIARRLKGLMESEVRCRQKHWPIPWHELVFVWVLLPAQPSPSNSQCLPVLTDDRTLLSKVLPSMQRSRSKAVASLNSAVDFV